MTKQTLREKALLETGFLCNKDSIEKENRILNQYAFLKPQNRKFIELQGERDNLPSLHKTIFLILKFIWKC